MRLFLSIVYIAIIGILAHFIGEALPRRWFNPRRAPYAPAWKANAVVKRNAWPAAYTPCGKFLWWTKSG